MPSTTSRRAEGYEPDLVVFLQCTSPLRRSQDIDGVIEAMEREGADTLSGLFLSTISSGDVTTRANGLGINHDKRVRLLRQDSERSTSSSPAPSTS